MSEIIDLTPASGLDWFRLFAGLLGAYFVGMAFWVIHLYGKLDRRPVYHVRMVAAGNVVFVSGIVYAQFGLIGQPPTRISWVVAILSVIGLIPMCWGLHTLLRHTDYQGDSDQ